MIHVYCLRFTNTNSYLRMIDLAFIQMKTPIVRVVSKKRFQNTQRNHLLLLSTVLICKLLPGFS